MNIRALLHLLLSTIALALGASTAHAQVWRLLSMESTIARPTPSDTLTGRTRTDSAAAATGIDTTGAAGSTSTDVVPTLTTPLSVSVAFGEGSFELRRHERSRQVAWTLQYDADRVLPKHKLNREAGTLAVGTEKLGDKFTLRSDHMSEGTLLLPADVSVNASLDIGAATATVDLGGLSVSSLHFSGGASKSVLSFSEPNRESMSELVLDGSAGTLKATALANARAQSMQAQVHLGALELEFGGEWTQDVNAEVRVVLGSAHLAVPSDVGVELTVSRVMSNIEAPGWEQEGDVYRSPDFDSTRFKLRIKVNSVLGSVKVRRGELWAGR